MHLNKRWVARYIYRNKINYWQFKQRCWILLNKKEEEKKKKSKTIYITPAGWMVFKSGFVITFLYNDSERQFNSDKSVFLHYNDVTVAVNVTL